MAQRKSPDWGSAAAGPHTGQLPALEYSTALLHGCDTVDGGISSHVLAPEQHCSALQLRFQNQLQITRANENKLYPSLQDFMVDKKTTITELHIWKTPQKGKYKMLYGGGQHGQPYAPTTNSMHPNHYEVVLEKTTTIERVKLIYGNVKETPAPSQNITMNQKSEAENFKGPGEDSVKKTDNMGSQDLVASSKEPTNDQCKAEAAEFKKKVLRIKKALNLYDTLLAARGGTLQGHINDLLEVADNLNRVSKGTKIAGITGGTAGAVGVAAAVGGVILAPLTMGASLAVTAVGVGVAAAGTATGASAAIANKVNHNLDRKKVEKILKDYTTQMADIEKCVKLISLMVEQLKQYNLSKMSGVDTQTVKVARVSQIAGRSAGAIGAISKSSGFIQGFTLGMDLYFTKEDSQKLKKGSETKFAKQIREVAEHMQASLDELKKVKRVLK